MYTAGKGRGNGGEKGTAPEGDSSGAAGAAGLFDGAAAGRSVYQAMCETEWLPLTVKV